MRIRYLIVTHEVGSHYKMVDEFRGNGPGFWMDGYVVLSKSFLQ